MVVGDFWRSKQPDSYLSMSLLVAKVRPVIVGMQYGRDSTGEVVVAYGYFAQRDLLIRQDSHCGHAVRKRQHW